MKICRIKIPIILKPQANLDYDIIKDKRYTLDKFQFHVPITMNFKADGILNINPRVNKFLKRQSQCEYYRNRPWRKAPALLHPDKSKGRDS